MPKKATTETEVSEYEIEEVEDEIPAEKVLAKCTTSVTKTLQTIADLFSKTIHDFEAENRKKLKEINKEVKGINKKAKKLKDNVFPTVMKLQEQSIDSSLYYVQVIDYLRETAHCLSFITEPCYLHLDNNHNVFKPEQFEDLNNLNVAVQDFISDSISIIKKGNYEKLSKLTDKQETVLSSIRDYRKAQLKRIKGAKAGTKTSLLYLNILHETQTLLLHMINLVKAQRDFVDFQKN